MSDLTVSTGFTYAKNGFTIPITVEAQGFTLVASGFVANEQIIGTGAHEALVLGEVATPGFAYFDNLDATNYVEIGVDSTGTFVPFLKLKAGQRAQCWLGTTAPYAKANTGSVKLGYIITSA